MKSDLEGDGCNQVELPFLRAPVGFFPTCGVTPAMEKQGLGGKPIQSWSCVQKLPAVLIPRVTGKRAQEGFACQNDPRSLLALGGQGPGAGTPAVHAQHRSAVPETSTAPHSGRVVEHPDGGCQLLMQRLGLGLSEADGSFRTNDNFLATYSAGSDEWEMAEEAF